MATPTDDARSALESGRLGEAEALARKAITEVETTMGNMVPEIIEPLLLLAEAIRRRERGKRIDERVSLCKRALMIAERSGSTNLVSVLYFSSSTCEEAGHTEDAVLYLQRLVSIEDSRGGDPRYALINLIHVLLGAGRPGDALPYAARRLQITRATETAEDDDAMTAHLDYGLCLREAGQLRQSLEAFREAERVANARKDVPDLRDARRAALAEVQEWMAELERALAAT